MQADQQLQEKQMKDFFKMYADIVNDCFGKCCTTFYAHVLDKKEESCVLDCAQKIMKASERIGMRFAEENLKAQEIYADLNNKK